MTVELVFYILLCRKSRKLQQSRRRYMTYITILFSTVLTLLPQRHPGVHVLYVSIPALAKCDYIIILFLKLRINNHKPDLQNNLFIATFLKSSHSKCSIICITRSCI